MPIIQVEISDDVLNATIDRINDNPETSDFDLVMSVLDQEPSLGSSVADALREAVAPLMR